MDRLNEIEQGLREVLAPVNPRLPVVRVSETPFRVIDHYRTPFGIFVVSSPNPARRTHLGRSGWDTAGNKVPQTVTGAENRKYHPPIR